MLKKLKTTLKYIFFIIIDILSVTSTEKDSDILLIRLDAIGDSIIWLDSAKEYKKNFQNQKITLICNSAWKDIANISRCFDEIISLDKTKFNKNLRYRYFFLKELKKIRYKKVISPVYSRTFFESDWLTKNANSLIKIGFDGELSNISKQAKGISDKWFTKLLKSSKNNLFELDRNGEFIENLINKKYIAALPEIQIKTKKQNNKRYCVIFLGASTVNKVYPIRKVVKVIEKIPKNIDLIFCGTQNELEYMKEFQNLYKENNKVINKIGKTDILEIIALIDQSLFVIGNDSACIHLAVATKTPSLCFLGGGHFERFMPYPKSYKESGGVVLPEVVYSKMKCFGCGWKCKFPLEKDKTWKCIDAITIRDSKIALDKILEQI